jgi:hypothetical protein
MEPEREKKNVESSESKLSRGPDDGSRSLTGHEPPVLKTEQSGQKQPAETMPSPTSLAQRATGPRTPQGKERSKLNALRHGIFSEVVVLKGESHAKYRSLLEELGKTLQPEGKPEEILVEKLAAILWRQRRLLIAEGAEIRKGTEFLEWDQRNHQQEEAEEIGSSFLLDFHDGLIRKAQNPIVLERCLELLAELREAIGAKGFDPDTDRALLQKIYGNELKHYLRETLCDSYSNWLNTADTPEEERQREGYATPEQCKENVLHEIDAEIRRLKRYQKTRASIEADRTKLEMLRQNVPDSPGLDRLLRYEASLERAFERTLSQLERLQRIRLGQPVPPPIKVQLSG